MKRVLCAAVAVVFLLLCAACARGLDARDAAASDPASSTSRGSSEPVKVTETHADAATVGEPDATAAPQATAPAPSSNATPVATPATGAFPIIQFAGAVGLILICSAGLLILRRI